MRENISPHISHINSKQGIAIGAGFLALVATFFISGELLNNTSAERINVNIGDGAYYMNITADDLDIDIDATPAGVTESVQKDIVVSTNSGTGYKLYLSMNNNETNGNRLYYNGDKTNTNYIIPTSSSSLSTNSWGYSTDGSSYSAVPLQGNEAVIGQSATSPSSPVTHSVYYGFNVNNTLPFGSYSGVVTYTAVADAAASPTAHTSVANYLDDKSMADPAGGDTLVITTSLMTNMANIGDVTVSVGGTNCPVTATSTKNKYAEVQCTLPAKSTGSYAVSVTFTKFNKTYNTTISYFDSGMSFGVGMKKIRTMQSMTTDVCNNIPTPAAFQSDGTTFNTNVPRGRLHDTRDANYYHVKKTADGSCWMDQNLNLDLGKVTGSSYTQNTDVTTTLTSDDTDINYGNYKGSTAEADNTWLPPYNTSTSRSSYDENRPYLSFTFKDTADTGGEHTVGTAGRFWNGSVTSPNYSSTGDARNHFGNYYTWITATANSVGSDHYAHDSICPKGWQIPEYSAYDSTVKKSYWALLSKYGMPDSSVSTAAKGWSDPLHFYPASWIGGSSETQTSYYWANYNGLYNQTYGYMANAIAVTSATGAVFNSTYPTYFAMSVRCVAR